MYDEDEADDEDGMHGVVQEEDDQLPPEFPYEESGPPTEEPSP